MSRSSSSQTSCLARSRLLALPLVAVCAVAYMGSVLHFALVQHVTCLEHGEVVHVGEEGSHEAPLVEASFDDVRVTTRAEVPAGHGSEAHCLHSLVRREAPPSVDGTPTLLRVPTRSAPAMSVFRFHAEPVARLHLAPKASPPLA